MHVSTEWEQVIRYQVCRKHNLGAHFEVLTKPAEQRPWKSLLNWLGHAGFEGGL